MSAETLNTAPAPPQSQAFAPLCRAERTRLHSLSNVAIITAILAWIGMCYWMQRLEKQMRGQREVQQALLSAIDATGQKIVVCDEEGTITMTSPGAEKSFGVKLIGRNVHDFCQTAEARLRADAALARMVKEVKVSGKPVILMVDHVAISLHRPDAFMLQIRMYESCGRVHIVTTFTPKAVTQTLTVPMDALHPPTSP